MCTTMRGVVPTVVMMVVIMCTVPLRRRRRSAATQQRARVVGRPGGKILRGECTLFNLRQRVERNGRRIISEARIHNRSAHRRKRYNSWMLSEKMQLKRHYLKHFFECRYVVAYPQSLLR